MEFTENLKKHKWAMITIIVLFILGIWWFATRATYPDIYTPKPLAGNSDATVKIVEFSDFQCPWCGKAYPVITQILKNYGDQVSFEYKQFPLTSLHKFAFKAAEASECANDQEKFWDYYDILFMHQTALTTSDLKNYAEQLNLDTDAFDNCLDSDAKTKYVTADFNEGIGKGVQGTPSFFINGQALEGVNYYDYANFSIAVECALNQSVE